MTGMVCELAGPADDAALRQLLRDNPIPGRIAVTFEREPCYFHAAALEGPLHQTLVVRGAESGALVGMGSRSARCRYVNGEARPIGYISQLRVRSDYGWGLALARTLARGFALHRALHADGQAPFYLCSIVADNEPARRLLASGLPGLPAFREYGRLHTYAINTGRSRPALPLPRGLRLQHGAAGRTQALLECLARNGRRRQFAPQWTAGTLFSPEATPGLRPEDFWLTLDGERVVGCLALWDQSAYKQTVVRGYAGAMGRWRWLLNTGAKLGGWPRLPPVNAPFKFRYASHLAVDEDNPRVMAALLRAVHNEAVARGDDYFVLGMSERDPLREVVTRGYRPITYTSQLYLVAWEDGLAAVAAVDARVPGLEIALL